MFFSGYVERSLTVDSARQRLMCREAVAVLDAHLPVSLRHPVLKDVLQAYAGLTGLVFAVPDAVYAMSAWRASWPWETATRAFPAWAMCFL